MREQQSLSPDLEARFAALSILDSVLNKKQSLDNTLENNDFFLNLDSQNKAFVRMLTTTTLRRLGQIDDLIRQIESRPDTSKPINLMNILRIGITQILFMQTADHAAVDTSVKLAEYENLERYKGFVNFTLRETLRSGSKTMSKQDEGRLNTPGWLLETWIKDYDLKTAALIAQAHLSQAPLDITLKSQNEIKVWLNALKATHIHNNTLRLKESSGLITNLPGYDEGAWWVQDTAAALPAYLFGDLQGKTVYDLCAAPGGKTLQLAAMCAHVVAMDRSAKRLSRLKENANRVNLNAAIETITEDASQWKPKGQAEYILLDAPCSATGIIRRHPDIAHLKTKTDIERLANLQESLLNTAFQNLKPEGILIYCTCSIQKSEGENQIEKLLSANTNAKRIPINKQELPTELENALTQDGDVRILPYNLNNLGGIDGFFISRITKQ